VEGPPVRVVAEELAVFKGKIVKVASGNAMHVCPSCQVLYA